MMDDYAPPPVRRLRVYAFDPQASLDAETAALNQTLIELPWDKGLKPGPVSDYLEVIDADPENGVAYAPVDLDHPHVLAQQGLDPSESDPRFHQQMVFAVATNTIRLFERALGRRVMWSPIRREDDQYEPVPRLRIYPHALPTRNAFYSPARKALMFGYFRSTAGAAAASPNGQWVFTALSHDVIAHETTHAILDGLHRRLAERTHIDSAAFHEGIADIVALFTRFTNPVLVRHALHAGGGRFDAPNLLTGLARQYGEAGPEGRAIRNAIDPQAATMAPDELARSLERTDDPDRPHLRGQVLVQALFAAFAAIFHRRTGDLRSLTPSDGRIEGVVLERLTADAVMTARQVLNMALRALDYLPPVDVRLGDYLRALVTADADLVPNDPHFYRQTLIDAFRARGIVPADCASLAPENLRWHGAEDAVINAAELVGEDNRVRLDLEPRFQRDAALEVTEENRRKLWNWLHGEGPVDENIRWERALGLFFDRARAEAAGIRTIQPSRSRPDRLRVEVHSVRTARRVGPDGQELHQLIMQVTQRRRGYDDPAVQAAQDAGADEIPPDFWFRGGATVIIDLREGRSGEITSVIRKPIHDEERLCAHRTFRDRTGAPRLGQALALEPFAIAHRAMHRAGEGL